MTYTGLCLTGPMDGEICTVHDTDVFSAEIQPRFEVGRAFFF